MRPLSRAVLWAATTMVFALLSSAQAAHDADVRQLQQLEKVWNEAHESGDVNSLDKLWADDMEVAVPKMPVMTKTEVLRFASSGRMNFSTYNTSDIHIRIYDNAAVLTGGLQRTRSLNGKEVSDDWRFTKVYIRSPDQWRVVSFQASEAETSN